MVFAVVVVTLTLSLAQASTNSWENMWTATIGWLAAVVQEPSLRAVEATMDEGAVGTGGVRVSVDFTPGGTITP